MPKPFNKSLHDDISLLKSAKSGTNSPEYQKLFSAIMEKHKLSRSTIYEELTKEIPGIYRTKSMTVPIEKVEILMVKKLLLSGVKTAEIIKILNEELGINYTPKRLAKIKKHIASAKKTGTEFTMEMGEGIGYVNSQALPAPIPVIGELRKMFYRFAKLKIDSDSLRLAYSISIGSKTYHISGRVIKDCLDHIVYSAANGGKDIEELSRFDMETILLDQLHSVKRGYYMSPAGIKQLESIRKSLSASDAARSNAYNFFDVYRVVKQFAPKARRHEIATFLNNKFGNPDNNQIEFK